MPCLIDMGKQRKDFLNLRCGPNKGYRHIFRNNLACVGRSLATDEADSQGGLNTNNTKKCDRALWVSLCDVQKYITQLEVNSPSCLAHSYIIFKQH